MNVCLHVVMFASVTRSLLNKELVVKAQEIESTVEVVEVVEELKQSELIVHAGEEKRWLDDSRARPKRKEGTPRLEDSPTGGATTQSINQSMVLPGDCYAYRLFQTLPNGRS